MEHDLSDFGTGLLAHLRRSPHWVSDRRELVRVPWARECEAAHRRTSLLAIAPLVAALVAALTS